MSVSLESWEGVADTVGRYFAKSAPPYYTSRYIEIAVEIIGGLLGKTSYSYVETCVSLPEPIWLDEDRGLVFFSVPMMSLLINQPVRVPQDKVKYVSRFDIFDRVKVYDDKRRRVASSSGDLTHERRKKCKRQHAYETGGADFVVNWNAPTFADRSPLDEFGLDESDVTVLVQTFRLVLMVSHWYQHYTRKTSHRDHDKFHEIEMADTELYRRLAGDCDGGAGRKNENGSGCDTSGDDSDSEPEF